MSIFFTVDLSCGPHSGPYARPHYRYGRHNRLFYLGKRGEIVWLGKGD